MDDVPLPTSEAQVRMLRRAAQGPRGETFIGRGQSRTARALAAAGLGRAYSPDAFSSKFAINDAGRVALSTSHQPEEDG